MKITFNLIKNYLKKKEDEKFSGSLKLSYENGVLASINELNKIEIPFTEVTDKNILEKYLTMADDPFFYGAIVFSFDEGVITGTSYSRTYRGDVLKEIIKGA